MSAWRKIDDLRDRVASSELIEVSRAECPTPEAAVEALAKKGWVPGRLLILGWSICLSRRKQDDLIHWHFSAVLHPRGRSSTEHDWKVLGRIAARVGAPEDPIRLSEDPHAVVHWAWNEP